MFSVFTWFFLSLGGRLNRQEFPLGYVGSVAVLAVLIRTLNFVMPNVVYYNSANLDVPKFSLLLPTIVALLVVIWPLTAIFAKRLHDINLSGWWLIMMMVIAPVSKLAHIDFVLLHMIVVAVLGLIPGTHGNNRFGLDRRVRARI